MTLRENLAVVLRDAPPFEWYSTGPFTLPGDWHGRSDLRDGEWHAVVTLAHEPVAWEDKVVPAFAHPDPERLAWEQQRGLR